MTRRNGNTPSPYGTPIETTPVTPLPPPPVEFAPGELPARWYRRITAGKAIGAFLAAIFVAGGSSWAWLATYAKQDEVRQIAAEHDVRDHAPVLVRLIAVESAVQEFRMAAAVQKERDGWIMKAVDVQLTDRQRQAVGPMPKETP